MSAYAAAAAAIRTALGHLRGINPQGTDSPLTAAVSDLERVATLLEGRAVAPKTTPPAAPPRVCLGCGSTKCRPGACNRATARKPAAPPPTKEPAATPASPPAAKPATPPPAKAAPEDFTGLKGYARLRQAVKEAEGLSTLPKGDRASLVARLETAKGGKPATPPTVPGLFVPDGHGGYRPASEAEVWAALEALSGKKAA